MALSAALSSLGSPIAHNARPTRIQPHRNAQKRLDNSYLYSLRSSQLSSQNSIILGTTLSETILQNMTNSPRILTSDTQPILQERKACNMPVNTRTTARIEDSVMPVSQGSRTTAHNEDSVMPVSQGSIMNGSLTFFSQDTTLSQNTVANDFNSSVTTIRETQMSPVAHSSPKAPARHVVPGALMTSSQFFVPETQMTPGAVSQSYTRADINNTVVSDLDLSADSIPDNLLDEFPKGTPIETIISRLPPITTKKKVLLFRGPKDPLSAFYPHPLRYNDMNFSSAEQAYQFLKMLHHKIPQYMRDRLLKCRNAYDVKLTAAKLVPVSSSTWNDVKFTIMKDICYAKLKQCKRFRESLLNTNDTYLLHNTETDNVWGCGMNLQGQNMMGMILMEVRKEAALYEKDYPPLPKPENTAKPKSVPTKPKSAPMKSSSPSQTPPTESSNHSKRKTPSPKQKTVLIIGNSNVRGLSAHVNSRGINSIGYTFPGRSTRQIMERIPALQHSIAPDAVVCHTGDIDVRMRNRPAASVADDIMTLVRTAQQQYPKSQMLVSGLPPVRNQWLNERIDSVNHIVYEHCAKAKNISFMSNAKSKLRDNIHLTDLSKEYLAREIVQCVRQCF